MGIPKLFFFIPTSKNKLNLIRYSALKYCITIKTKKPRTNISGKQEFKDKIVKRHKWSQLSLDSSKINKIQDDKKFII